GVTADAAGNVWLLDAAGHRVVGYSPDGTFIASHGREGQGPGEINMAFGLAAGPGDTLWVMEAMNSRLTGFPLAGGEPRIISFDSNASAAMPIVIRDDALISGMRFFFAPGGRAAEEERRAVVARFSMEGALQDTIASMLMPQPDVVQIESGSRRMMMMSSPRFSP